MKEAIAVYPGTFDPFTRGHEDLCSKLAALGASIGSRGASMETAAGEDRSP